MTSASEEKGFFGVIHTQRAIRRYSAADVPDEVVHRLIEAATRAPSGSDSQPWRFVVVRDAESKRRVAEYYRRAWAEAFGEAPDDASGVDARVWRSADHLANHMSQAPVLVLVCIEHDGTPATLSRGASIYPAVQNLLLAARALGVGSVLTTLHRRYEGEIKALLGIPANVDTAALLPLGYPAAGVGYGPSRRRPVREVAFSERWCRPFPREG